MATRSQRKRSKSRRSIKYKARGGGPLSEDDVKKACEQMEQIIGKIDDLEPSNAVSYFVDVEGKRIWPSLSPSNLDPLVDEITQKVDKKDVVVKKVKDILEKKVVINICDVHTKQETVQTNNGDITGNKFMFSEHDTCYGMVTLPPGIYLMASSKDKDTIHMYISPSEKVAKAVAKKNELIRLSHDYDVLKINEENARKAETTKKAIEEAAVKTAAAAEAAKNPVAAKNKDRKGAELEAEATKRTAEAEATKRTAEAETAKKAAEEAAIRVKMIVEEIEKNRTDSKTIEKELEPFMNEKTSVYVMAHVDHGPERVFAMWKFKDMLFDEFFSFKDWIASQNVNRMVEKLNSKFKL